MRFSIRDIVGATCACLHDFGRLRARRCSTRYFGKVSYDIYISVSEWGGDDGRDQETLDHHKIEGSQTRWGVRSVQ